MSDKGGTDKDFKDFDNEASAIENETRARVERAENLSIEQASADNANESNNRKKSFCAAAKFRIFSMTILGAILGAAFIFAVVFFAVRLGSSDFFRDNPSEKTETNNDYFSLSYHEESILYSLGDIEEQDDGSYLLEKYAQGGDSSYILITRLSQLRNLQFSFQELTGEEKDFEEMLALNDEFFDTGSVIAVAVEGRYLGSLQTTKISRNADFDLDITMKRTSLDAMLLDAQPQLVGYLNLIRVDNVQPKQLTLYIENN